MSIFAKRTVLFTAGLLIFFSLAAQIGREKIAEELLRATRGGEEVACIITFLAEPDLTDLPAIHGKSRKGTIVFQRLQNVANKSQERVLSMLTASSRPYRTFFIVNAVLTTADERLLNEIAQYPEVKNIRPNPWIPLLDWRPSSSSAASARTPVEWGLDLIHVPEVWEQGITGAGVVIGNQDTGVEWTHPTLMEKYRAWTGSETNIDHRYHWFDAITSISPLHNDSMPGPATNPCGLSVDYPCDDNNHGTYTMGISVGDDGAGNQIGVAPGSQWIACRNMERGYGSPATYLAGFEWFLAPTDLAGNNPRPELAPHVINNSWGCPEFEGCNAANWGILETAVENLRAAGVVVVVSAGNQGPSCGSVDDPGAIFAGSFSIGATNSLDTLARFSSRGPVTVDGSDRLKPDVVAPGVFVRSARRNNEYMAASGTSAAAPFVTGVVALIIEANPALAGEVDLIEQILRETAVPAFDTISCAGFSDSDIPNPMTGYGRIDALAAVERARETTPGNGNGSLPEMKVYPNPGHDQIYFSLDQDIPGSRLQIFNATGQLVEEREMDHFPYMVDLTTWAAGMYWWKWSDNGRTRSGKIIKQ